MVPNVVDHAIAEIRHVLGESGASSRLICTIAGEGYRFIAAVEKQEADLLPCAVRESLAILPFATMGLETTENWLGLGLADVLIARIGALREIPISPFAAVSRYSDQSKNALDAGRELRVAMVLEGAIQRSERFVRVTMRLLRVADGKSLWAATYDEEWTSVFAMEDSICGRAIPALLPRLDAGDWKEA